MPHEPTEEERKAVRQAERATLEALPEEEQRELFGTADDAPLPSFYNKNTNQCPEGGACYEHHKIVKPDGKVRRGRKHLADCPQGISLAAHKKLKR